MTCARDRMTLGEVLKDDWEITSELEIQSVFPSVVCSKFSIFEVTLYNERQGLFSPWHKSKCLFRLIK